MKNIDKIRRMFAEELQRFIACPMDFPWTDKDHYCISIDMYAPATRGCKECKIEWLEKDEEDEK